MCRIKINSDNDSQIKNTITIDLYRTIKRIYYNLPGNNILLMKWVGNWQEVRELLKGLKFVPGYVFVNDVGYAEFLDRVHKGEQKLRSKGVWDVPHPWLNLLVASPRIGDFHDTVFKGILAHNLSLGPILLYPINRHKYTLLLYSI